VKETEQESQRESSLEKRMDVLTERERAYGKQLGVEWERESEREWEWEQQPQNEPKWDEQMQGARIEQRREKETEREQVHAKEQQRESERGREWTPEPSNEPKQDERKKAQWNERD
jgi:hypothetical protein